jgi:hypothetical protein
MIVQGHHATHKHRLPGARWSADQDPHHALLVFVIVTILRVVLVIVLVVIFIVDILVVVHIDDLLVGGKRFCGGWIDLILVAHGLLLF